LGIVYLDSDLIETIHGDDRFEYLSKILADDSATNRIRALTNEGENVLVLVFSEALGGFPAEMKSTPRLNYCGQFLRRP
jgi:hypothetical protein